MEESYSFSHNFVIKIIFYLFSLKFFSFHPPYYLILKIYCCGLFTRFINLKCIFLNINGNLPSAIISNAFQFVFFYFKNIFNSLKHYSYSLMRVLFTVLVTVLFSKRKILMLKYKILTQNAIAIFFNFARSTKMLENNVLLLCTIVIKRFQRF